MKPTLDPPRPNLATPKQKFQMSSTRISDHREMVGSDIFQEATDSALLEYQSRVVLGSKGTMEGAAAGFLKIAGAHEFVLLLKNLAENIPVPAAVRDDNLNPRA